MSAVNSFVDRQMVQVAIYPKGEVLNLVALKLIEMLGCTNHSTLIGLHILGHRWFDSSWLSILMTFLMARTKLIPANFSWRSKPLAILANGFWDLYWLEDASEKMIKLLICWAIISRWWAKFWTKHLSAAQSCFLSSLINIALSRMKSSSRL